MTWMVTGGAGYIGAHVVDAFRKVDMDVVVLDSLASGHRDFVPKDVALVKASVVDVDSMVRAMETNKISGVVHLAGFKYAGVSVREPLLTYQENVTGIIHLLQAMQIVGVNRLVYSSSAAVYGTPDVPLVTEKTPTNPESPYGESKLIGEWLIRDQARVTDLKYTSLRYFNVVGSGNPRIYDSSPHNLFPLVLRALADGGTPKIFGDDYDTPDGTCIRDYVHVADLAVSHVTAGQALEAGETLEPVYNLGSGEGISVKEIMDSFAKVGGSAFTPVIESKRPGDPARIVADGGLAARDLQWRTRYTIDEMVDSAYQAYKFVQEKISPDRAHD